MSERKRRVFPDAFKHEAVERVRTSGMTIIAVAGCMRPRGSARARRGV